MSKNSYKQNKLYNGIFSNYSTANSIKIYEKLNTETIFADNIFKELLINIFYFYLENINNSNYINIDKKRLNDLLNDFKNETKNEYITTELKINIKKDSINILNFIMIFYDTKLDSIAHIIFHLIEPIVQEILYIELFYDYQDKDDYTEHIIFIYNKMCSNKNYDFCDSLFKQLIVNIFYSIAYQKRNIKESTIKFFYEKSEYINQTVTLPIKFTHSKNIKTFLDIFQDHPFGTFTGAYLATLTIDLIK